MTETKYLWIIRHAKSSWADSGQSDFERGLNARGDADGARLQSHLAALPNAPQWLWCSAARRAQATGTYVQAGFGLAEAQCISLPELYQASAQTLLEVLQRTPAEVSSVAIVAHNPGLTHLVNCLGNAPVTDNLPTLGVAEFEFTGASYTDLAFGSATLRQLITPKSLRG